MLVYQGAIGVEMWAGMATPAGALRRTLETAFRA